MMQQDAAVGRIDFRAEMLSATRAIDHVVQSVRHRVHCVDHERDDSFLFILRSRDPLAACHKDEHLC